MLGIPTILGALILLLFEIQTIDASINLTVLIIGFLVSMIFAFLTIKLFLNFVEKIGMMPFVIYRLLLGAILILLI
jgi:undecaprenyl-diphosphatase